MERGRISIVVLNFLRQQFLLRAHKLAKGGRE